MSLFISIILIVAVVVLLGIALRTKGVPLANPEPEADDDKPSIDRK